MTRVVWGSPEARIFETGLDRGMLYPETKPGVPWNGLISVSEKSNDSAPTSRYLEGQKFQRSVDLTEFSATVKAFTYPDEFLPCEGVDYDSVGMGFHDQAKETFGMAYRTLVESPLNPNFGYKIHLVYNALATISDVDRNTASDTPDPTAFSWDIDTIPFVVPGRAPTAHYSFDTRKMYPGVRQLLEGILYGTPTTTPRLPSPTELADIIAEWIHDYLGGYGYGPYGHGPYGVAS